MITMVALRFLSGLANDYYALTSVPVGLNLADDSKLSMLVVAPTIPQFITK